MSMVRLAMVGRMLHVELIIHRIDALTQIHAFPQLVLYNAQSIGVFSCRHVDLELLLFYANW